MTADADAPTFAELTVTFKISAADVDGYAAEYEIADRATARGQLVASLRRHLLAAIGTDHLLREFTSYSVSGTIGTAAAPS